MVVDNTLRYFVGDTVTGKIMADIPAVSPKFGLRLNDAGTVSASIRTFSKEALALDLQAITSPVKCFLGVSYGSQVIEAGPIWTRSYNAETGILELNAAGIWSVLDRRKAIPGAGLLPGAAVTRMAITLKNLTLGSIARELVRISLEDNPYGGQLQIELPPKLTGVNTRVYQGYDLGWVGDRLRQLTEVQNGPDIRFQPYFTNGDPSRISWRMVVGSDAQPLLSQIGEDWVWDASAMESGVTGLSVVEDATELAAKAWAPGSGQDANMLLRSALDTTLVDAGYPWTEVDSASKDIEDLTVLQGYANQTQADASRPWETWTLGVRADTDPKLGLYLPGDWAQIRTPEKHPIIRQATHRVRIMSIDGSDSATVKLGLAPIQVEDAGYAESITTTKPSDNLLFPGATTFPGDKTYPLGQKNDLSFLE